MTTDDEIRPRRVNGK